jgi:hypothetical protein
MPAALITGGRHHILNHGSEATVGRSAAAAAHAARDGV